MTRVGSQHHSKKKNLHCAIRFLLISAYTETVSSMNRVTSIG